MSSRALVMVMNAREIPECVSSFAALTCDVAWLRGMRKADAIDAARRVIQETRYDHYLLVPDDCIVSQAAVDAVVALLDEGRPAATGWCRLAQGDPRANLTTGPIRGSRPRVESYDWWLADDVWDHPDEVVPTGFMGMALTGMSRGMWMRFPPDCYRGRGGHGWSADFSLSSRLRDAGVPMVAARSAYIEHVKERWGRDDRGPGRRLLVGVMPREVVIQTGGERVRAW